MAFTSVKKMGEGRRANENNFIKRYVDVYKVISDAVVTDFASVKTADVGGGEAVPTLYVSTYPSDATLTVVAIDPRPIDDTFEIFEVFVTYEAPPAGGWFASPPSRPWVASVSSIEHTFVPQKAVNAGPAARNHFGAAVAVGGNVNPQYNTADEPWDSPVEDVRQILVLNLKKALLVAPTITNLRAYLGAVNLTAIQILGYSFNPRELKMTVYETGGKQVDTAGNDYYDVTWQLHVAPEDSQGNRDTWDLDILNVGWNQFDAGGDKVPCVSGKKRNERPTVPENLQNTGTQYAVGGGPLFLENRIKVEKEFSVFAFPGTWP